MRCVIERVSHAQVEVEGNVVGAIKHGYLIYVGIHHQDDEKIVTKMAQKVLSLRIFEDENQKINLSLKDINGEVLLISQFTLYASCKKGNRPSFIKSAKPEIAEPLYNLFIDKIQQKIDTQVQSGKFGADMQVEIHNDGPVTIILDSKNRE